MATPTSKSTFKDYCLRSLGFGVIDINVSDDQVDDRIDEALQYFAQYHYDGIERMYLKHKMTQAEIDEQTREILEREREEREREARENYVPELRQENI